MKEAQCPKSCLSSILLPFYFRAPLQKPNSRKKGTLIIKGLLRNQGKLADVQRHASLGCNMSPPPSSSLIGN